jgi:hypothetical protein
MSCGTEVKQGYFLSGCCYLARTPIMSLYFSLGVPASVPLPNFPATLDIVLSQLAWSRKLSEIIRCKSVTPSLSPQDPTRSREPIL